MHPNVQPDYSVGTERYKLIYFNKIDRWELFDLGKNRHELKNVNAETPASAGISSLGVLPNQPGRQTRWTSS